MTNACAGRRPVAALVMVVGLLAPTLALAHHPTGGMTPQSAWHGLLSGIGHPVLGPDHLAFIVGLGLLMAMGRRWTMLPLAFVGGMLPGVLVHLAGIGLGPTEVIVALSVAAVGLALLLEPRLPSAAVMALAAAAGLFHGHAFGETIVGAETAPIAAYLVGLSLTIAAMLTVIAWLGRKALAAAEADRLALTTAAGMLVLGGLMLTVQSLTG